MWSAEFPGPSDKGRAVSLTANKMMGPAISADRDSMVRVWSGVSGGQALSGRSYWRDWSCSPGKGEPADKTAAITAKRLSKNRKGSTGFLRPLRGQRRPWYWQKLWLPPGNNVASPVRSWKGLPRSWCGPRWEMCAQRAGLCLLPGGTAPAHARLTLGPASQFILIPSCSLTFFYNTVENHII